MAKVRLRHQDYTVGWICALSIELHSAIKQLDEEHESLSMQPNDENLYRLGSISNHNIVITCTPGWHTVPPTSVAIAAMQMLRSFPSIRFALSVGIGAGVPSPRADIRLGDVVVSMPNGSHSGVVQWDLGRTREIGMVQVTGSLNKPPQFLLSAVSIMRAEEGMVSKLSGDIRRLELLQEDDVSESDEAGPAADISERDDAAPDLLFEPGYQHFGGLDSCDDCDKSHLIIRPPRDSVEFHKPVIHYGTIASGYSVIKDGQIRDRVSEELGGVLCFEMEATGLMNSLPCLAIRGIMEYADSHKNGRSWLFYAAQAASTYAARLLRFIAAAEVAKSRDVWGWSELHRSSHEGDLELVDQLLKTGSEFASQDNAGWTALHHATKQGFVEVSKRLLGAGVDPNAQDLTGSTALHFAARDGNEAMVKLLLSSGTDDTVTNSAGKTARKLAEESGNSGISALFDQSTKIIQPKDDHRRNQQRRPNKPPAGKLRLCKNFDARVEMSFQMPDTESDSKKIFSFETTKSVHSVIYDDQSDSWEEAMERMSKEADVPIADVMKNTQKWIHLPANNRQWVKDLVERLCNFENKTEQECNDIIRFIDETFYEHKGSTVKRGSRMPSFQTESDNERGCQRLSLVLPYIDMDSEQYLDKDQDVNPKSQHFWDMRNLIQEYHDENASDIHVSRTLDQSYYEALENTNVRDHDQVVYRYTKSKKQLLKEQKSLKAKNRPDDPGPLIKDFEDRIILNGGSIPLPLIKILMVNQLWLWQIDSNTVITAFPERWHKGRDLNLMNSILRSSILKERSTKFLSPFNTFLPRFVNKCINFVEVPYYAGLDEPYFNIFASSIASVSDREVQCYKEFSSMIEHKHDNSPKQMGMDIGKEIKYLQEIKDIRDELNMLARILADQRDLVSKMIRMFKLGDEFEQDCGTHTRCNRVKKMDEDAERVEKSLNHLLDLKQKQSNLEEAISARMQAQDTALQGQYILVFTIVTIIFTPLSFMAALFAISIREFPHDNQGLSFEGSWIGKYMAAGEFGTLGLVACIALVIFERERIAVVWQEIVSRFNKQVAQSGAQFTMNPVVVEDQGPKWRALLERFWPRGAKDEAGLELGALP